MIYPDRYRLRVGKGWMSVKYDPCTCGRMLRIAVSVSEPKRYVCPACGAEYEYSVVRKQLSGPKARGAGKD